MVEHHLAKVRVAGSNPVVRSEADTPDRLTAAAEDCGLTVEWPSGEAAACKAVYVGSNPISTSYHDSSTHASPWAIGAAVARFPDTEEVTGSIPVSRTHRSPGTPGLHSFQAH